MLKLLKDKALFLIIGAMIVAGPGSVSVNLNSQDRSGTVSGTVVDKTSGVPIEGADVTIHRLKDSTLVKGTSTDAKGSFTVEVPFGRYYLRANIVGYNFATVSGIAVNPNSTSVVLEPVKLTTGNATTEEILVEGEKSLIEFHPDKKVFNVSKSLTSQGGTLIDLLKEIPAVTVDQDNNISLRGSEGVKIMIDGRTSGLEGSNRSAILESIPASEVESIELVTNPSAKYEAEGSSGIINIILKKNDNKGFGYNGTLGLNLGTGDKYNGQFSLALKNNKVNLYGNYNFNSRQFISSGTDQRYNYISNLAYFSDEVNSGKRKMQGNMFKLGLDYYLNQQNTIGVLFSFRGSKRGRSDIGTTKEYDPNGNLTSDYFNTINSDEDGLNFDINANYTLRFKTPQQVLSAELRYSRDKDEEFTNTFDSYNSPVNLTPSNRNEIENQIDDSYSAQADYVHPFSKDIKLEAGYKGTNKKRDDDYRIEELDYSQNQYVTNYNFSNRFIYKEQIHGAYAIYTQQVGSFGFSLGTRVELTLINGELVSPSQVFDKNYIDFFPSLSLSQKLSKTSEIQLSYAKRINRPRFGQLNPFVSVSMMGGSNNLSQGNPNLNPEFTDSYELSYIHYLPIGTVTPSVFYRQTKDEIARSIQLIDSVTTLTSFVNYNSSRYYGGEIMINSQPLKIWSLNGTFSYYKTEVDASNLVSGLTNDGYSWSARAASNLILPADLSFQLTYMYHGKRISAQGTFEPVQMLDAGLKKDLFDKNLSITFRVSDIFNTAKFKANVYGADFSQISERSRDSRTFFLNISYKFGQQEKKPDRRKKNENNDNNEDEGFDY